MEKSIEQLKFYPPETKFFIKLKNFETGDIKILKDISLSEYEKKYIKYCKYLNVQGYNVFLSPGVAGGVVDILLDDVKESTIRELEKDGFEPLYYLETSPNNFQAIIRLSPSPLDRDIQTFISRQLTDIYSADPNSSDVGHFFRLAGYTNRKAKYRITSSGLYPFVKLYAGIGLKPCTAGQAYIENILAGINAGLIELPKTTPTTPKLQLRGERKTLDGSCFEYIQRVYATTNLTDVSRLDFKAVKLALAKGFPETDIFEAVRQLSPNIEQRKKGHISDYVSRTIRNASARF